jgi:hypothetical protein
MGCHWTPSLRWHVMKRCMHLGAGVSATVDLRGRLGRVGLLDQKAAVAQANNLSMVVISADDFRLLEAEDFASIEDEGVRAYARQNFRGAATMLDAIELTLPGRSL